MAEDGTLLSAATTGGIFSPCMLHFLGCVFEMGKDVHHEGERPGMPGVDRTIDDEGLIHDTRRELPANLRPSRAAIPDFGGMMVAQEQPTGTHADLPASVSSAIAAVAAPITAAALAAQHPPPHPMRMQRPAVEPAAQPPAQLAAQPQARAPPAAPPASRPIPLYEQVRARTTAAAKLRAARAAPRHASHHGVPHNIPRRRAKIPSLPRHAPGQGAR